MTLNIYINIEIGGCATRTAIMAAAFLFRRHKEGSLHLQECSLMGMLVALTGILLSLSAGSGTRSEL